MKLAMCNEFCEDWPIEQVLALAARAGYEGVELAPYTLATDVRTVSRARRRELAAMASDSGTPFIGLHWLLAQPPGLHISHPEQAVRRKTVEYFLALIEFCADLGGTRMIFGSPAQRKMLPGTAAGQAWNHAIEFFRTALPLADQHGITICIEPLARAQTDFINTVAEGLRLCRELDHPRFRLHLDVLAMCDEGRPLDELVRSAAGFVAHVHANDANTGYPGSGATDLAPVVRALKEIGYDGWISVEVFDFGPGPETIAAAGYATLRRLLNETPTKDIL